MEKVTLVKVSRKDMETKYGIKPNIGIQTEEYGDRWLSSFATLGTEKWKEGDVVEVEVTKNGDYLNFKPAGATSSFEARIKKLEEAVFGGKDDAEDGGF